ncbi:hypothetical protein [Aquabacterium sp.]|uniref:hypothetical protein n=1 Tax=Aquabacterium sp. TaxID=1872578 RepID=UPI002C53578E|nr:hypothetical protein [Aquabacterium sp.]HSW04218.1 hypothetical protein [Aquabacterium sp.]
MITKRRLLTMPAAGPGRALGLRSAGQGLANRMKADTAQIGGIIMMRGIKVDS